MALHPEDAPYVTASKSADHQMKAEEFIRLASLGADSRTNLVAKAQVHATLALVEVIREQSRG